jgi:hypothetical protein
MVAVLSSIPESYITAQSKPSPILGTSNPEGTKTGHAQSPFTNNWREKNNSKPLLKTKQNRKFTQEDHLC